MIIEDPRAWIKKYFKAASEEYFLLDEIINGIKEIKFSSRPAHAANQNLDEIDKTDPKISVDTNRALK